ncbi:MAG: PEP-CTERM sorting domain-containing protein [Pirellulales bacterium]|nr:PEP-CTERM sorting domain-containing protein [Pirellulales bacterium]
MRWQVLVVIATLGLLVTTSVQADIIIFSVDPNLATEWTQFDYYNPYGATASTTTATWNSTNQNLELTSNLGAETADRYRALYKTGATRSDTDGVTVTFSDYIGSWDSQTGHNTGVGLVVSSVEQGNILSNVPQYEFFMSQESGGYHYAVLKNGIAAFLYNGPMLAELPSTIELEILRDGSDYVFNANGVELVRDSSVTESLSYYCLSWAVSGANTLSVSADNFGTVPVPEPSMLTLLAAALLGMLCYNKRDRK